jgi:myo-inositol-1(or 4)-monophosphatase
MTPKDALEISRMVAEEVRRSISKISPNEVSIEVGIGKDGTPTKKIDKIAEDAAIEILRQYDFTIVSEEAGVIGNGETFVALDPIDGTFNSVRDIPFYSIALCFSKSQKLKDTFLGYVVNLATGIEYWSNGKAYKNGERIRVSDSKSLKCNAIVYYPDRKFGFKRIRILGSAALEICLVADGTFDCFIDYRGDGMLRVFDVAASLHIAKCAGAIVTDTDGNSLDEKMFKMEERFKLLVSNKSLHSKLLELMR